MVFVSVYYVAANGLVVECLSYKQEIVVRFHFGRF